MRSRAGLHPFQVAGARFLAERRFAILADEQGLGRTAQVLAAFRELDVAALVLTSTVAGRNLWEAEVATTPGLTLDRSRSGILPSSPRGVRVMTSVELLRRKLSPKAALRTSAVLVVDEGQIMPLADPRSRFRVKLARLVDAFLRADGGVWLLLDPDHPTKHDQLYDLLAAVGFLLRRRRA